MAQQRNSDSDLSDDNEPSQRSSSNATQGAKQRPPKKRTTTKSNKVTAAKKRPTKHIPVPRKKIVEMLIKVMNEEMRESLEWLKESLGDAIEDYEVGSSEGIPLVPVMDYAETAMDNAEFQRLLKAFGLCPPFDEQEVYWRIPISLTPDVLQGYCDLIQQAVDDTLQIDREPEPTVQITQNNESSDDEDVFAKLRTITKTNSPDKDEDNSTTKTFSELSQKTDSNRLDNEQSASIQFSVEEFSTNDSEDGTNTKNMVQETDNQVQLEMPVSSPSVDEGTENTNIRKKSKKIFNSDSEEEEAVTTEKRHRSASNSDSEKPVGKRGRIIDSDED